MNECVSDDESSHSPFQIQTDSADSAHLLNDTLTPR